MGIASRRKGALGELEVLELVRAAGWPRATRNFASGAAGHGDIAFGPQAVAFEIKRTDNLRFRDAWRQAAAAAGDDLPVVATRWDRGPWLGITELDELLALLALRERG